MHVPTPEQVSPVQPAKTDPGRAQALKVTACPSENAALQTAPQEMPSGLDVTSPKPLPTRLIPSEKARVTRTVVDAHGD